ncbi:terpene cyclase/mutase family protein [Pseudenhygromyxa sp. WMMC2535]|uniref:prenyltransferase/squalene oxidase repeat-containing protein n=1 Tax=Pseudenhygromyxa sp. WMMC2535 TaxID=2712867 RepID=UPI001555D5F7|nr:prenyltransferase/squalene oxidase repeat-containing protein [Pseudenhygromyxa sp. WMMC2535]NVB37951.1 terpene cyclase/mutase family protein [Pseudenhygromyxa sp. WMMC2535]
MLTSSLVSVRDVPPRPALDREVLHARDFLTTRVLESVRPDGAILGDCESRVLESALALHLLRVLDRHLVCRERAVGYLRREWRKGALDPFHRALVIAALGLEAESSSMAAVSAFLDGFEHFSSRRKHVLFNIILGAVGGAMPDLGLREQDFVPGPELQRWVSVMTLALGVLYFVGRGQPERIDPAHIEVLKLAAQPRERGQTWEQYLLARLLAMLALAELPGERDFVARSADELVGQQRFDGGFSFIASMEIFATATAGLGLVGAGLPRATLCRLGDYLAGQQRSNGGWGYAHGVNQTDVDDTAYCVEFLRAVDPFRYHGALRRAEAYMVDMQNLDGGFPTFVRGAASEVAMTAAVLNALAPSHQRYRGLFSRALKFIANHQDLDGTFERSWSSAHPNAIFRALLALQTQQRCLSSLERLQAERRAMSYLRLSQNDDGGWGHIIGDGSDPISSAYALITLSHFDAGYTMGRGVSYLIDQQQSHGGFSSRPDQSGPRPIAYDVPVLADNFALIALNHVISTHPLSEQPFTALNTRRGNPGGMNFSWSNDTQIWQVERASDA